MVIVGGSVAGLAAACAATMAGREAVVLERRRDLLEGGRAFTIQVNGLTALESLGVLDRALASGQRIERVVFRRPNGRALATYDYRELDHPHAHLLEIRPADLRLVLASRLAELGGEAPRLGVEVEKVRSHEDRPLVVGTDASGSRVELEADLVIAADGLRSTVTEQLGIGRRRFRGGADDYVLAVVDIEVGDPTELSMYCGPRFGNGVAPVPRGTYVWDCVTDDNRDAIERRDLDAWKAVYATRIPPDSPIPGAIASWDDLIKVRVEPSWSSRMLDGRVLLVGDAAAAVHAHSAQGANLSLEDAAELVPALRDNELEQFAQKRLRRRRAFVAWSLFARGATDAPNPLWRAVQRGGFLAQRVPLNRRLIMHNGAGAAWKPPA